MSLDYRDIITIEAGKRSGKPCIRGLRITVYDVLEWLADGMTLDEIVDDFPSLSHEDIVACLRFISENLKAKQTQLKFEFLPTDEAKENALATLAKYKGRFKADKFNREACYDS